MLLRRITKHVKDQNWFAVGIDFVIVVVGVFIGLQVANWNEARGFAARETGYLEKLRDEIAFNNAQTLERVKIMRRVMAAGHTAHNFLSSDKPCEDDCWRVTVDMFHATQVLYGPASFSVYDQMQRLDLPKSDSIKKSIADYYQLEAAMVESFDRNPVFRRYVRKALPTDVQSVLWRDCYELVGLGENLIADCKKGASDQVTRAALETLKSNPDVAAELNYWLSMHSLWRPLLIESVARGEATIQIINDELDRR